MDKGYLDARGAGIPKAGDGKRQERSVGRNHRCKELLPVTSIDKAAGTREARD